MIYKVLHTEVHIPFIVTEHVAVRERKSHIPVTMDSSLMERHHKSVIVKIMLRTVLVSSTDHSLRNDLFIQITRL